MTSIYESSKIRLLHCRTCDSLEELPDFDGPPEHDTLLNILTERHTTPSGDKHIGHLFDVEVELWSRPEVKKEIIKQIRGGGSKGLDEFDASFYDTKNTFHEDALVCYQRHNRPKESCQDWLSDSKILVPDTKAERKAEGLSAPSKSPGPKIHLCRFCPVQRYYARKANEQKGIL